MAKKSRLGQKQCPQCSKWIKGTRSKTCPNCSYEFQPKSKTVKPAAKAVAAPVAVETATAKANGTITVEQVRKVAQTVHALGGIVRMTEVLEVIKEAGGVKKFRELAEAMAEPEVVVF